MGAGPPVAGVEVAGVALLVGSAAVAALAAVFAAVLEDVLEGDGIAGIDQPAAGWLATHRDLWLTTTLRVVTAAGGPVPLTALAVLTCAAVVWRCRSWPPVVLALVGFSGVGLVIVTAKALVIRNRPHLSFAVIAADGHGTSLSLRARNRHRRDRVALRLDADPLADHFVDRASDCVDYGDRLDRPDRVLAC